MMGRKWTTVFLFFLLFLSATAEAADLFGVVRFQGQPLRGSEVLLKNEKHELKSKTNEKGYYSIRNAEAGNYTLTIQLPDKSTRQEKVRVFPQNTEKNIELK